MLLENKTALIYGAAGAVGAAVAQRFAREGARVCLVGRSRTTLERVADRITAVGGTAATATVDAFDEHAVAEHADAVAAQSGGIDISVNLIGVDHIQGRALADLSAAEFARGVEGRVLTNFLTAKAAARHMLPAGAGVILTLTAAPDRVGFPMVGSFGVACAALEALTRSLAIEWGPAGIRAVCLRSAGSPDAPGVDKVFSTHAENAGITRTAYDTARTDRIALRRLPALAEVANIAAVMASDRAAAMTATTVNITCGEILD